MYGLIVVNFIPLHSPCVLINFCFYININLSQKELILNEGPAMLIEKCDDTIIVF